MNMGSLSRSEAVSGSGEGLRSPARSHDRVGYGGRGGQCADKRYPGMGGRGGRSLQGHPEDHGGRQEILL